MNGHAEIAGAGIAGLGLAIMLAKIGWAVRVHERSPEVREIGTGIQLKNNAIEVLERIGVFSRLAPLGIQLERGRIRDPQGRILQERVLSGKSRVHVFLRQSLIEVLRDAALESGVEIQTNSAAIAADARGRLLLEDGQEVCADLVVAADGAQSRLRTSLGIGGAYRALPTVVNRYLVPSREFTPDLVSTEHWSGRRRIGIMPCGENLSFLFHVSPEWDQAASKLPIDIEYWSKAYPRLRREIEVLARGRAIRHNFIIVRCPRWHIGRVAIVGDAAHGLPPTLGQGAGLTLMNAYALVIALEGSWTVQDALEKWESSVRYISDRTQRWALRYHFVSHQWPEALGFIREGIIQAFRIPALNRRMRVADHGINFAEIM
jgi:2-polyprenyl-6-methoxyphenol hydroxylase-like FAD-dependent oxidoreductase